MACLEVFMVIGESAELDLGRFAGRVFSGARDLFRLLSFAEVSKIKSFKSLLGWQ
jgi:hypothetical protein